MPKKQQLKRCKLPVQYSSIVQWQYSCAVFLDSTVASFLCSFPRSYSGKLPVQYSSIVQWQASCAVFLDRAVAIFLRSMPRSCSGKATLLERH